jgi:wobble nucleotide-excising tRNase
MTNQPINVSLLNKNRDLIMIKSIEIKGVASYIGTSPESLSDLSKINFIYGSNGSGKTTISRIIANSSYSPSSVLTWKDAIPLECLVYNRDFVIENFNQSSELKGIFSLGKEDGDIILSQIKDLKSQLNQIESDGVKLTRTLGNENNGKEFDLKKLEHDFEESCWKLKQKYDDEFQEAFTGCRAKKSAFKTKLINENQTNSASLKPLTELKNKAKTIFGNTPKAEVLIGISDPNELLNLESHPILSKKVIGKEDVDISAMIEKLNNSDWVKQGRNFYNSNEDICPFCQRKTDLSFANSLNAYFDLSFEKDTAEINNLFDDYKSNANLYQQNLQSILASPSKFLDIDTFEIEKELLDSKISHNLRQLQTKQNESSRCIELETLKDIVGKIKILIDSANKAIKAHNQTVANIDQEKITLTNEIWLYLQKEIETEALSYTSHKTKLEKAISSLSENINKKREEYANINSKIKMLEKEITSIQPTVDGINCILESVGFTEFKLARCETPERDKYYKIQRLNGTDARESLSEGEKTFITFLYFYHLLKGSKSENGIMTDRIVVFDDPVSSLDSDILFVVSSLIKALFDNIRTNGNIKQIFVLTHNVYFHKEITFNHKRGDTALSEETFWIVRKFDSISKIQKYDTNPIKTSYELLWIEVRNPDRSSLSIQNTLRKILENYFKILGNMNVDRICDHFEGQEKMICKSLFSWINDGSHFSHDDLYISIDQSTIETYLKIFKEIFYKTNHKAHYCMMMGKIDEIENII